MLKRLSILSTVAVASVVAQQQCHTGVVVGNVNITDGSPVTAFIAQTGGTAKGGVTIGSGGSSVTVQHNYRAYVAEQCLDSFQPNIFRKIPLLGRTLSFTADLSQVGCACNAALYLTYMPAYNSNQQPDPTKCEDYYCDANNVCGVWCPEIDIMEANKYAFQATPHKCDAPTGRYYPHCDGGGCGRNTYRLNPSAYGPGSNYTIDTRAPFEVSVSFNADAAGSTLDSVTTELRQSGRTFRIVHDSSCGGGYLAALSDAVKDGMVVTVSYWGDKSSTMSWLDIPPCAGDVDCDVATSFTFSNLAITKNN